MALIDLEEAKTALQKKCDEYGCTMLSYNEICDTLDEIPEQYIGEVQNTSEYKETHV